MAESMSGLARTHRCTEVSSQMTGEEVTVMGWVQKRRNLGSLIFIDLRDRSGLLQLVFDEESLSSEDYEKANGLRSEYVIAAVGTVQKRSAAVNENLKTGDIEIKVHTLRVLSESDTPPFPIDADQTVKDELRLKYRYLDLRRPNLQRNLRIRDHVTRIIRNFLSDEGFIEIETPILGKSTPEGARDYLVPSRVHPGSFYGLPQSPQLYKQLLMCSGFDRYYQIAKCFRDEDLRADRQPEFTQADMELSFVDVDDVIDINERLMQKVFKEVLDVDIPLPMQRLTYQEAMDRFGSDKPDTRFGMELVNVSDTVSGCDFMVFKGALEHGGSVRGINAKGLGDLGRKKIDGFVSYAKDFGAKGLAYIQLKTDGTVKSSFAKFMKEDEMEALIKAMDGQPGDLLLFAADQDKVVFDVLGNLRIHIAKQYDMIDESLFNFLWVTDFPLLEWSEEQNRYTAMHHPFTMPFEEDLEFIDTDPGKVRAKAYDIVLNGTELGGGSIRIHQNDIQEKMFEVLGFTKEDAYERFGFLLDAFKFGVPPHAGLAYGLDRLVMWLTGEDSIRDVIAFPKVKDASCLMTQAPGTVDEIQLDELGIEISKSGEES
ncbi:MULTISPECIES: aspartate--tRNA ligase [Anaerostipes]|uniref:Aspartate--tRNA ligase n=1 Tax=Anaerostipes butyraticus TaxID=645466 RepID=A0A916Q414_9FIRM|nr:MULTISPECIES: aspartate--tRNA ligase [Anaerostipes]GFO84013.1 aspartate--tRNA ligase [Anaerostipes butyraticus]HJC83262.1 aspartate--tRNA ligase [Candidatus Anaerostipes avicola]